MGIDLAFITYNRLDYTKLALASILADSSEEFNLYIWDNASTDGTVEYLQEMVKDKRIKNIIFSKENVGQTVAVNNIWSASKADLLGKLDNDCIVTPGWTRILSKAHEDIENLGVIACWHFFEDDFNYELAKHKIQTFGNHKIFRHPWTCGTGLLIKRKTYQELGPIKNKATTQYWIEMAKAGYINGWYYPLVYQEHMDDPYSEHSKFKTHDFETAYKNSFGFKNREIDNMEKYMNIRKNIIENLMTGSIDARSYIGWRKKLRLAKHKFAKIFNKGL